MGIGIGVVRRGRDDRCQTRINDSFHYDSGG